ncbi:protein disulfide isomerase [Theileria orientalis]|uniref:Protein disulfide isomerase n=1 Tax=Theileria orientalis TaxID=68886 RepID=A0A976QTF3_THEOR|nr:protein disulfide isomerase [Theileria orientalis]
MLNLILSQFCSGCKDFSSVYKNLASVFENLLPVFSVNDDTLSSKYGVMSFPSVKIFFGKGPNSEPEFVDFKGDKDIQSLVSFTLKNLNKHVKNKASKFKSKTDESFKSVVDLTSSNFKSTVLDDTYSQWLVKFYAPWCGHCKNLEPEWMKLPKMSKGVKVGRVDCTVHQPLCAQFQVKGYPTILLLNKGDKSPKTSVNYQGPRRAKDILDFAKSKDRNLVPPAHAHSVSVLKEKCSGPLCLLFFLPEDSKEDHLETVDKLSRRSTAPFAYAYTLVGEHEQWERAFRFKEFPAVVGLNLTKGVFLSMTSTFSKENFNSFVSSILSGKVTGQKLPYDLVDDHRSEL